MTKALVGTAVLTALLGGALTAAAPASRSADWPQWRGPARDNVSHEKGLLERWPKEGPPLAWEVRGLGDCPGTVAVSGGRAYVLGQRDKQEHVTALEEATGKPIWSVAVGQAIPQREPMRWLSPRTPVVDGEHLYAFTAKGELVCLQTTGKVVWRRDYRKDFEGRSGAFGYCDHPLIDGNQIICVPGGSKATVVALNKETGKLLWKCPLEGEGAGYGATVLAQSGGHRHYIVILQSGLAGISPGGKLLWRFSRYKGRYNCYAAMPRGNQVLAPCGYAGGLAFFELAPGKDEGVVKEHYHRAITLPPWHEPTAWFGEHLYLGTTRSLLCLEVKTNKVVWEETRGIGSPLSLTCAGGHLYLRSRDGKVVLVEASPKAFVVKGALQLPGAVRKAGSSAPVVAGGRLYLRDDDRLFCYDVLKGSKPGKPGSFVVPPSARGAEAKPRPGAKREVDAIFVPTPQDVVEKMLELAAVKKADTVVDLGCGDGRIVVTAARKYGCKAVGYDLDPERVKTSRESVARHKVGGLVTIEQKDLFTVDLSKVDVVALYLLPRMNERLLPQLSRLRPGARVVAHAFPIPGVVADRVVTVTSKEDGVERKLFLYTAPLKKAKKSG